MRFYNVDFITVHRNTNKQPPIMQKYQVDLNGMNKLVPGIAR